MATSVEEEEGEEEDVAGWLALLPCEVAELAVKDRSISEMRSKARLASTLFLINFIKSFKVVSTSGHSEAAGWSAGGSKKPKTRS